MRPSRMCSVPMKAVVQKARLLLSQDQYPACPIGESLEQLRLPCGLPCTGSLPVRCAKKTAATEASSPLISDYGPPTLSGAIRANRNWAGKPAGSGRMAARIEHLGRRRLQCRGIMGWAPAVGSVPLWRKVADLVSSPDPFALPIHEKDLARLELCLAGLGAG